MIEAATGPARLGPDDSRYQEVVARQFNKRFRARPDYVRVAAGLGSAGHDSAARSLGFGGVRRDAGSVSRGTSEGTHQEAAWLVRGR